MILPVNASDPQAKYRGQFGICKKTFKGNNTGNYKLALVNAGGISSVVGGATIAIARRYTNNWAHAVVLGLCGSFLSMFFMTPQILAASGYANPFKKGVSDVIKKTESPSFKTVLREHLKPVKKNVHFKQQV